MTTVVVSVFGECYAGRVRHSGSATMDPYAPVKGKCTFWREQPNEDDRWDTSVKPLDRRVTCTCFIEGDVWLVTVGTIPPDCPKRYKCRYYVRTA
ncbi:MAG: hypothetical protein QMC79_02785 [Anaerosomatales bacterium]|nr:hypothetical protein [Anaerosomatales bacterium]